MAFDLPEDLVFRHFRRAVKRNISEQRRRKGKGKQATSSQHGQEDHILETALAALSAVSEDPDARDPGSQAAQNASSRPSMRSGADAKHANGRGGPGWSHATAPTERLVNEEGSQNDKLARALFQAYWEGFQSNSEQQASQPEDLAVPITALQKHDENDMDGLRAAWVLEISKDVERSVGSDVQQRNLDRPDIYSSWNVTMGREYISTADELKSQLRSAERKRSEVEMELQTQLDLLPENPGMSGPLVDREGYPRADVDVAQIRQLRQNIIRLRNDQKQLTEELAQLLQQFFAASSASQQQRGDSEAASTSSSIPQQRPTASTAAPSSSDPAIRKHPIATVDQVAAGSPASEGGLAQGDKILHFGGATGGLAAIAELVNRSEGRRLEAEVLRRGEVVQLYVTPCKWTGRGLLGASLLPL